MEKNNSNSTWSTLSLPLFRGLWIASLISQVGTWMHDIGAAWLMASLSTSPLMVSLIQTATALPMLILVVPSGAMADIFNRRKLLLFSLAWLFSAALLLAMVTLFHWVNDTILLLFTLLIGTGAALNAPAWQAITPEVVPRGDLSAAITLNGIAMNVARVLGPALGGFIIAGIGIWAVFLINALSFLVVIIILFQWERKDLGTRLPAEQLLGAITAGFRYLLHTKALQHIFFRTFIFMFFGAGFWGLFPLYVKQELGLGPTGYGTLLACFGFGAVIGAFLLPKLRKTFTLDQTIVGGAIAFSLTFILLFFISLFSLITLIMFMGGLAWLSIISGFNIASQTTIPDWVRARALSFYILTFFGGITIGSLFWGFIAKEIGISPTFMAIGLISLGLNVLGRYCFPFTSTEDKDLSPSLHWPIPNLDVNQAATEGPLLVLIDYLINPNDSNAFKEAMQEVRRYRLRDGAIQWGLYKNIDDPQQYTEFFLVETALEHLRQHERLTMSDRLIENKARAFHKGETAPKVSHYLSSY